MTMTGLLCSLRALVRQERGESGIGLLYIAPAIGMLILMALVAGRLMDGYRRVGRPQEGVNLLRSYLAEASSIDLIDVVFKAVIELDGVDAAKQLVVDELRRNPTLLGLDKLLEARLLDASADIWDELSMVKNLVHGYTAKLARYQCSHCGFKARQFYWQCPGCSRWETYPPRRTEELNVMN